MEKSQDPELCFQYGEGKKLCSCIQKPEQFKAEHEAILVPINTDWLRLEKASKLLIRK